MQILLTIPAPKSKAIKYALYHAIITALLLFLQYNRQNIFFFAAALIPAWIFTLGFVCMSDLLYLLAPRVQCIAWSAYVHSIRCTLRHPIVRDELCISLSSLLWPQHLLSTNKLQLKCWRFTVCLKRDLVCQYGRRCSLLPSVSLGPLIESFVQC